MGAKTKSPPKPSKGSKPAANPAATKADLTDRLAGVGASAPPAPRQEYVTRLPLARIKASTANPRKTFDDAELAALAESIREHGVLQNLLVRPVGPAPKWTGQKWEGVDHFEIVAGERRFRAAAIAGVADVPVTVRVLTDEQARPLRHVENGQRVAVRVSEEATAVAEWAAGGASAEEISRQISKPLSAVRDLMRVGKLPAWALAAVDAGVLPLSTAALVAKVPGEESRRRAAACVLLGVGCPSLLDQEWNDGDDWEEAAEGRALSLDAGDPPYSYRDAKHLLAEHFTRQLKGAPFSLKVVDLTPAGSCDACPKRAGNDPEAKAEGVRADVCLDPDCYREKVAAHDAAEIAKGRKRGLLPAGDDFAWPGEWDQVPRGWCDVNHTASLTELGEDLRGTKHAGLKLSELLRLDGHAPGGGPLVYGVLDPKHKLRAIMRTGDVRKLLTSAGVLKKPERKPAAKPAATRPSTDTGSKPAGAAAEFRNIDIPKSAEKPPLYDTLAVEDRAADIGARVLGEMAAGDCGDVDAAAVALRMVARFLIRDHCDFGEERRKHVARALGFDPETAYGEKAFQAKADELPPADVLGLCVRLTAGVVLEGEGAAPAGFARDLLEWGQLDWPQLLDQARRELAGGPAADERIDAAEAAEAEGKAGAA